MGYSPCTRPCTVCLSIAGSERPDSTAIRVYICCVLAIDHVRCEAYLDVTDTRIGQHLRLAYLTVGAIAMSQFYHQGVEDLRHCGWS